MKDANDKEEPWYREGLRFQCTGCGQCCTGAPGYTWVAQEEIQAIAESLSLSLDEFSRRYLRRIGDRWALKERSFTFDCIFLEGKRCRIYPHRPKQCQTFPWWKSHLSSPDAWERASRHCEGISPHAPLVAFQEIQNSIDEF